MERESVLKDIFMPSDMALKDMDKFVGLQHVLKDIFMPSDVALKDMDKFVGLQHVLEKSSVFFITCLLDSFKVGKKIVYDN